MALGRQTGTKKKRRATRGWKRLAWKKDPHCHYCGKRLANVDEASTDHVKPLALGGYSKRTNYVLSCHPCNKRKGAAHYADFVAANPLAK